MKATIRSYDASVDSDAAFELWGRSIGRSWPVEREDFDAIVHEGFVALLDDQIEGVVAFARLTALRVFNSSSLMKECAAAESAAA